MCKPITNPTKILNIKTNINYAIVAENLDNKTTYPITKNKEIIQKEDVQDSLSAGKDPQLQPKFIDVLYLQLDNISNLASILTAKNPTKSFSDYFSNFDEYNQWINKFQNFQTKEDFVNAFSGAITLKDI